MIKLGRNYILTISGDNFPTPLIITLPFTIEFDITRNTLTSANVSQIRLYNLSPQNRNLLRKNAVNYGFPIMYIVLQAGYGTLLPIIFSGNVSQAWNVREGTNFITQLECFDGGYTFINAKTNLTVPAGTPYQDTIANLITGLAPQVTPGVIGDYPGVSPREITYSGDTVSILQQLTGFGFFVDNGIGNALGTSEYNPKFPPPLIDYSTGLLNTPILETTTVRFDMIFEPSLSVGGSVYLKSVTEANFNGFYKITAVKHRGMISQTVCGEAITTGEFFYLKTPVPGVSIGA